MSEYKNHIVTSNNILIIFDDRAVSVSADNPLYVPVKNMLRRREFGKVSDLVIGVANGNKDMRVRKINVRPISSKQSKKSKKKEPGTVFTVKALRGSRNRVKIPSRLFKVIGVKAGEYISCFANEKTRQVILVARKKRDAILQQILRKSTRDTNAWALVGQYVVYEDGSVKIGPNIMDAASLTKAEKFMMTVEESVVKITATR